MQLHHRLKVTLPETLQKPQSHRKLCNLTNLLSSHEIAQKTSNSTEFLIKIKIKQMQSHRVNVVHNEINSNVLLILSCRRQGLPRKEYTRSSDEVLKI